MKRIAFLAALASAAAGVILYMASALGQADGDAAPIYGIKIPAGYRDWRLISVKQLAGNKLKQLRAQLGNDLAIQAFREGKVAFPDGAIIAALHWNEASSDLDNQVLATGFPGAGLESVFAASPVNVQFMVKDSKKIRRLRRLGICGLHQWQARRSGTARKMLSLPRACKRSRLRFHSLRTDALN
jgi:hypothetical protein